MEKIGDPYFLSPFVFWGEKISQCEKFRMGEAEAKLCKKGHEPWLTKAGRPQPSVVTGLSGHFSQQPVGRALLCQIHAYHP